MNPLQVFVCSLLICGSMQASLLAQVAVTDQQNRLHVDIDGKPFTDYWYGPRDDRPYTRPFFFPVLAADGTPLTSDQYLVPKGDHPHHQSLWVAHSNVNGVDHWSLLGKPPAKQRHVKFEKIAPDGFVEHLVWDDQSGQPLLDETRTAKFLALDSASRAIDLTVTLDAAYGPLILHDAKDAGLCSVRVAKAIADTVTVSNSAGQKGEKQCWGRAADWCDESGTIDGRPYGVAIFDAPENPLHPTRWHVREYGLMSANPFGLHDFEPKKFGPDAGALRIEKGKSVTFSYRVVFHEQDAAGAKLDEKYKAFAAEPGSR